jgi:very-short-patch-repair endonuclease/endogenous inhibitor of DNA gyrase (YacG/DUF329 family)
MKIVTRICEFCGQPFERKASKPGRYCSHACHDDARKQYRACETCGKHYRPGPNGNTRRYCSRECAAAQRRLDLDRACAECGAIFRATYEGEQQDYCSHSCAAVALQKRLHADGYHAPHVELTCEQCGKQFAVKPSEAIGQTLKTRKRYCSRACKAAAARKPWPLEQTTKILYTCQECGKEWYDKASLKQRKRFCSRVCAGMGTIRHNATLSPTSIEAETYAALAAMDIAFEPQYSIGHAVVDAFIPSLNIVVECLGDFYHCNPAIYPDGPHCAIQRKAVDRDPWRRQALAAAGYRLVELWEKDIKEQGAQTLLEIALGAT